MNKILLIILLILVIFGIYININKQYFVSLKLNSNNPNDSNKIKKLTKDSIEILMKERLSNIYINNPNNTKAIDKVIKESINLLISNTLLINNTNPSDFNKIKNLIDETIELYLKPKLTYIINNNPSNFNVIIDLLKKSLQVLIYIQTTKTNCVKGNRYDVTKILNNIEDNIGNDNDICAPCKGKYVDSEDNLKYEYQDKDNQLECKVIILPKCNAGQKINFDPEQQPHINKLNCVPCPTYTYQDMTNHQEIKCNPQPTCQAGQKYNDNKLIAKSTCVPCTKYTYQNNINHRVTQCKEQPKCQAGTKYPTNPPKDKAIQNDSDCTPCDKYKYLDDDMASERATECKEQPTCQAGTKYPTNPHKNKRIDIQNHTDCTPCDQYKYLDDAMASNRATKCNPHEPCEPGKHINTDKKYYNYDNDDGPNTYPVYINHMINDMDMINDKTGTEYTPEEYYKHLPVHEKLLTTNCVKCDEYTYLEKPSINSDYNNYGRHYEFECNPQPTCQSGSKYDESSTRDTIRTCISCDKYEYLDQSISQTLPVGTLPVGTLPVGTLPLGRGKTCLLQPKCSEGTFYPKNFSKEKKLNVNTDCKPCGENTYQDDMEHRNYICKDQPLCNAGEIIAFPNSTLPVEPGLTKQTDEMECRECELGTYTHEPYHRKYRCEQQPTCSAGEKYPKSPRIDKLRECIECDSNEYLTNAMANDKATECKSQPYCGSGNKMTPDTITNKRDCEACPDGTFQDNEFHRESQCLVHPSINGDKYLAFYDEKSKNKQPGIFKTFGEELKECNNKDYCLLTDNMSGNPYNIYKETTTQV